MDALEDDSRAVLVRTPSPPVHRQRRCPARPGRKAMRLSAEAKFVKFAAKRLEMEDE